VSQPTRPRALIVLEHPAQHFAESFRTAARSSEMDVSVLYWTDDDGGRFDPEFDMHTSWDVDLHSGYPWCKVDGGNFVQRAANFRRIMGGFAPDVVICFGWGTPVARLTTAWCALVRRPLVFFGDTTWQHRSGAGGCVRSVVRSLILRGLFRMAAGALSTGTFNREFYILHGMHPSRVVDSVCPIDVDSYSTARTVSKPTDALKNGVEIGFAGKLIPRKGVAELLHALARASDDGRWNARIIGDGPERNRLEKLSSELGIVDRVRFIGFRNTSEMPHELASCDIVVVPSLLDMRVLVITEAMAAGAVVVASSNTAVWGRGDLLEDGVTGRVYRSGDPAHLAEVLKELIANPDRRAMLQAAGAERALGEGPNAFVASLERAVAMFGHG
jgi:glycosyltransferase involved in cell wall biosynthesis